MALIDMSKPLAAPGVAPQSQQPVLDVVTTGTIVPVGPPTAYIQTTQMDGEFSNQDIAVPFLKIGQKTSSGVDDNPAMIGAFVWGDGLVLGKDPMPVVFLRMSKYYMEKVAYGEAQIPKKWRLRAEADAAGVEYEEHGILELLIEVPKAKVSELEEFICLSVGDTDFLAARMDVKTRAYRNTIGVLLRDKDNWLKGFFYNGKYTIATDKRTDGKNTWFVPTIKACGPTAKDLQDEIRTRFGI